MRSEFEDTIAAISTPLGFAGIGIVRLSGRDAIRIADEVFFSPKKKTLREAQSHRMLYGYIVQPDRKGGFLSNGVSPSSNEVIDEVLVSVMRAPYTYTREDVVEINCHGGPLPLRKVLELLLKGGARLAEPGEFTKRAFLNGRIDLAQAEAVLDLISAMTEQAQRAAMEQLSGGLSKKVETLRDKLIELTAFVEAYIDFPEEDIEALSLRDMNKKALEISEDLRQLIDSSRHGVLLREGLKCAIIGRPNVGKSSLLNALLQQDRAIVTEMPGTTRDVIEEYLDINGLPVRIMDTAGIREARNIAEREGVQRSLKTMQDADIVLLVLDGSEHLHDTDRQLIEESHSKNTILVINKIDLLGRTQYDMAELSPSRLRPMVKISALKGTGLEELRNTILDIALGDKSSLGYGIVTNIRHVKALEMALSGVDSFMEGLNRSLSPELLSVELKEALDAIGEIIGITTSQDILNKIFSTFCIGK